MILVWSGWGDGRAEREGEVGERLGGGYVMDGRMDRAAAWCKNQLVWRGMYRD